MNIPLPVTLLLIVAAALLMLTVSTMDYNDFVQQEANYNAMVCEGTWPDYRDARPDCTKTLLDRKHR